MKFIVFFTLNIIAIISVVISGADLCVAMGSTLVSTIACAILEAD